MTKKTRIGSNPPPPSNCKPPLLPNPPLQQSASQGGVMPTPTEIYGKAHQRANAEFNALQSLISHVATIERILPGNSLFAELRADQFLKLKEEIAAATITVNKYISFVTGRYTSSNDLVPSPRQSMYFGFASTSSKSLPKEQTIAAFWRVVEGDNDACQQHKDIGTVLEVLKGMPDDPTPPPF
jgi:hypothetical protein